MCTFVCSHMLKQKEGDCPPPTENLATLILNITAQSWYCRHWNLLLGKKACRTDANTSTQSIPTPCWRLFWSEANQWADPNCLYMLIYAYTCMDTHVHTHTSFPLLMVTLTAWDSREIAFSYQGAVPTLHLTPCEAAKEHLFLVGNDIIERQQQIWQPFFHWNTQNDLDKVR